MPLELNNYTSLWSKVKMLEYKHKNLIFPVMMIHVAWQQIMNHVNGSNCIESLLHHNYSPLLWSQHHNLQNHLHNLYHPLNQSETSIQSRDQVLTNQKPDQSVSLKCLCWPGVKILAQIWRPGNYYPTLGEISKFSNFLIKLLKYWKWLK